MTLLSRRKAVIARVKSVLKLEGRPLTLCVGFTSGLSLFLLDLARFTDRDYPPDEGLGEVYIWGSLAIGLVAGGLACIFRSTAIRGIVLGSSLLAWGVAKALLLGSPAIIPPSYAALVGTGAGTLVALDGMSALRKQIDSFKVQPLLAQRANLKLVREELQFYIDKFLVALIGLATIVGVTMSIVYTGRFIPQAIETLGADAERSQRTALALGMLLSSGMLAAEATIFGALPIVGLYWETRARLAELPELADSTCPRSGNQTPLLTVHNPRGRASNNVIPRVWSQSKVTRLLVAAVLAVAVGMALGAGRSHKTNDDRMGTDS